MRIQSFNKEYEGTVIGHVNLALNCVHAHAHAHACNHVCVVDMCGCAALDRDEHRVLGLLAAALRVRGHAPARQDLEGAV